MIVARRVYLYGIAFASLWMLVFGLADLLQIALEALAEALLGPFAGVGAGNLADRVSFASALTAIGLVTWLIHWGLGARALRRDGPPERGSAIRKLYLYAVLLVGGLTLVFATRSLLVDLFEALFGLLQRSDVVTGDVVAPTARLVAVGAFWGYHARVAARDRAALPEVGAGATLRRWCVYGLAFVGLMLLLFGAAGLLTRLVELAVPTDARTADSGRWLAVEVSGRAASTLAGLLTWLAAWSWSTRLFARPDGPDPESASVLRKVYLYLALLVVVTWTVWSLGQVLYVLIRSLLIPSQAGALWSAVQRDLGETVANALVFGLAWAYHAAVIRREAAAAEHQRQATIRWIYGYLVALVGAAVFAVGAGGTLATLLDLLTRANVSSDTWWQERLSLFATLIAVGLPVWLVPWQRLQREVVASVARRSLARRIYLFLMLGLSVLALLGTGAYTVYQLLRAALGQGWSGAETSDLIDTASAALVAALLLVYHLRVFQRDAALAQADAAAEAAAESDVGAAAAEGAAAPLAGAEGRPAVPAPDAAPAPSVVPEAAKGAVTLLVVRPASPADAARLHEQLLADLPDGTIVREVRLPAAEAARLLDG